ncbi:MAG: SIMPL domain-containing protein [Marmoricola sp.]
MSDTAAPNPSRNPGLPTVVALVLALLLALAVVFLIGLRINPDQDPSARGVVTSGKGTATAKPDQLKFTVRVRNTAAATATAMARTNANVKAVLAALKKAGVAEKDITTTSISVEPTYSYKNDVEKITGYSSAQSLRVTVRDLDSAGGVISTATSAAGSAVSVDNVVMSISNKADLIAQARTKAVKSSKKAAEALAEAAGRDIGDLVYVAEATTNDTPAYPTAGFAADNAAGSATSASVPISSGQQKVSVTVQVRWSLS